MNMTPDAETLAKIRAQLEQESSDAPQDPISKALEGADDIRKNLVAIKGEKYAALVEVGVLVFKMSGLLNFLSNLVLNSVEGYDEGHHTQIGRIHATMGAQMLSSAAVICFDDPSKMDAEELTHWIDRIIAAEKAAEPIITKLIFGKD